MQMEVLESASKMRSVAALDEGEAQLEAMTAELDMDLGRVDSDAGIENIEAEGQAEFRELLEGLRVEPQDDDESMAKFQLFETFMGTVEKLRNETVDFYAECKADFAPETQRYESRSVQQVCIAPTSEQLLPACVVIDVLLGVSTARYTTSTMSATWAWTLWKGDGWCLT